MCLHVSVIDIAEMKYRSLYFEHKHMTFYDCGVVVSYI